MHSGLADSPCMEMGIWGNLLGDPIIRVAGELKHHGQMQPMSQIRAFRIPVCNLSIRSILLHFSRIYQSKTKNHPKVILCPVFGDCTTVRVLDSSFGSANEFQFEPFLDWVDHLMKVFAQIEKGIKDHPMT